MHFVKEAFWKRIGIVYIEWFRAIPDMPVSTYPFFMGLPEQFFILIHQKALSLFNTLFCPRLQNNTFPVLSPTPPTGKYDAQKQFMHRPCNRLPPSSPREFEKFCDEYKKSITDTGDNTLYSEKNTGRIIKAFSTIKNSLRTRCCNKVILTIPEDDDKTQKFFGLNVWNIMMTYYQMGSFELEITFVNKQGELLFKHSFNDSDGRRSPLKPIAITM